MAPRGLIPAPKFFTRNPTNFRCIRYGRQVSLILHTGILSPLSATFLEFPTLASSSPPSSVVPSNECGSQNVCVHLWLKLPRPRLNPVGFRCQSSFSGNPNYSAPSTPMVCVCVAPSVVGPSVSSGSGNLRRAPRERSGHTPALNLAPAPTPRLIPGGHVPKDKTDHELDLGALLPAQPTQMWVSSAGAGLVLPWWARTARIQQRPRQPCPSAAHTQSRGILSLHTRTWRVKPHIAELLGFRTGRSDLGSATFFLFFRPGDGTLVTPVTQRSHGHRRRRVSLHDHALGWVAPP